MDTESFHVLQVGARASRDQHHWIVYVGAANPNQISSVSWERSGPKNQKFRFEKVTIRGKPFVFCGAYAKHGLPLRAAYNFEGNCVRIS
jgi:hypothetical protein